MERSRDFSDEIRRVRRAVGYLEKAMNLIDLALAKVLRDPDVSNELYEQIRQAKIKLMNIIREKLVMREVERNARG